MPAIRGSFSIQELNKKLASLKCGLTAVAKIKDTQKIHGMFRSMALFSCNKCNKECIRAISYVLCSPPLSCGCFRPPAKNKKYILIDKYLPKIYRMMISRCYKPTTDKYKHYGGRGVTVCDEWLNNPQSFFDWAANNGWKKGLQIDKDKLGDGMTYSPENCCIVTMEENLKMRKRVNKYEYNGSLYTTGELKKMLGCSYCYLYKNLIIKKRNVYDVMAGYKKNPNTLKVNRKV